MADSLWDAAWLTSRSGWASCSILGILGRLGGVLRASWDCLESALGASWGRLRPSWNALGASSRRLGDVLGASWAVTGAIFRAFDHCFEACHLGSAFYMISERFSLPTSIEDFAKIKPPLQREHDFCKSAFEVEIDF